MQDTVKMAEDNRGVKKKIISEEQKRATKIAFNLLFPSLLVTAIAIFNSSVGAAIIAIALFFYQSALVKQYVDQYG